MSHTLIVPFAATGDSPDAARLGDLQLPQLQALLAGLQNDLALGGDAYSASAPHELAHAHALGLLGNASAQDGLLPWAALASGTLHTPCAWVSPCHFQVGMEQVSLLPPERLSIGEATARALHAALAPLCAEDGVALHWVSAERWLAVGERLAGLRCASLDRVVGRSLDVWQPRADPAHQAQLAWLQRLQSEAQMLFYTHRANDAREAQRLPSLNGVWFSGVGALAALPTVGAPAICDSLRQAALHGGRSEWQTAWAALDAGPLAELLQRQQAGESVALWLCGERWARRWVSAPATGWAQRLRRALGLQPKPSVADILGSL